MSGIELRDYQRDAVNKLSTGKILCGDVGSGKSRTALAYYYICEGGNLDADDYVPMKEPRDLIIITTARKRDTYEWDQELILFLLSIHPETNFYSNKVIVDSWNNIKKYAEVTNAFFIFDEQRVVGSGAWVKTFLKITKSNDWILLSATPGDQWTDYIPVFIANGFYKNRTKFNNDHCIYKNYGNFWKVDRYVNVGRLIRLRNRILVTMDFVRNTEAHHIDICTDYDKRAYKEIYKSRWNPFKDAPIENASEFCYCLRKIVNLDFSRLNAVTQIMETHPRVIIFYNFDDELIALRSILEASDTLYSEWNGHRHQDLPQGNKWAYLVQYNAGNEGWNCTRTDTMIFFSQNYSYKTMIQAAGRIDRLNTPFKDLYYYHLISKSGIDLAISGALRKKKKFNEDSFVKEYSKEAG